MNEYLKKLREYLTKIPGMDKIELSDNDLLVAHNGALEGYTEANVFDLLTKNKKFQSVHDKHVNDKLVAQKSDLTKSHDDLLQSKIAEIEKLQNAIPRPNSPEAISERLKTETDPVEIRMLTLELSNAQAMAKNLELENQNKTAAALTAKNVLESNLRSHAKEKNYNLLDTSLFSHLGDKAIETLDAHHANTQTVFDAELSKIAQSKYGMTPEELSKRTPDKPKMTLDQIEALPTREERLEAMKEAGY